MKTKKKRKGYGLFRTFGWKKNLLAMAAGFGIVLLLDYMTMLLAKINLLAGFDPAMAVMPMVGFLLACWGVLGCSLANIFTVIRLSYISGGINWEIMGTLVLLRVIAMSMYCGLPSYLWYKIRLKGEDEVRYPRMDTSLKVLKYYLIMLVSVAVYVLILGLTYTYVYHFAYTTLDWITSFTQYLDVVLIGGLPLLILVSVIHNKTVTINERLVLGFLFTGVIASLIGGGLVYRTVLKLQPQLFAEYDAWTHGPAEVELSDEVLNRYLTFWNWYYIAMAIMLNCLLIIEMFFMRRVEVKVTEPLLSLDDTLGNYVNHGEAVALDSESVVRDCSPYRYGYGEVSSLTRTCIEMVEDIDKYTENLKKVTSEKERIGAELDVASKIQQDMLPGIFPPFPDRPEIDLFASMNPAKEVGGDFYDFYLVDHDHLALTIADVSGKGVPASLFMVISKTLLKNHAQSSLSPREILTYVNHQLCQTNDSLMFCTVWLGILDLRNGKLTAANAGHEYPAIRRAGGHYELFQDRHDPPLGLRDGLRFHEYELTLSPGDILFEYTDGVTEATNAGEELFGEERLVETLNQAPEAGPEKQIGRVNDAIVLFVKEAPQFDDITMLCVAYRGSSESDRDDRAVLTIPADISSLDRVMEFTETQLEAADCPPDILFNITLAVEEIFANVANYAYEGGEGDMTIAFSFNEETRLAEFVFTDSGIPFDPTSRAEPDTTLAPGERKIGGLGIHIVRKTMDEVNYDYTGGQNVLTMRKHI